MGQPGDLARRGVHPPQRRAPVVVGRQHQRGAVRRPPRGVRPAVPAAGQVLDRAAGERHQGQPHGAGIIQPGPPADDHRHAGAVRGHPRRVVLVVGVVGQDAARTGRDVDRHQRDPLRPGAFGHRPGGDHGAAVGSDVPVAVLVQRPAGVAGEVTELQSGVAERDVVGQVGGQQAQSVGAEVVVPEPHRVLLVQHRRDAGLLAPLAQVLVGGRVRRRRQHRRAGHDRPGRADEHAVHAAGRARDHPGVAARGRQQPQRRPRLVVVAAVGLRPGGGEQQIAGRREGRRRLALGAAGQPPRRPRPSRIDLPQRGAVAGVLAIRCRHGDDEPATVGRERQPAQPRQPDVGVEVGEGIGGSVGAHRIAPRKPWLQPWGRLAGA